MKILVTGGAGYIGSHACKALASSGFSPIVYDNLSRGHRSAVRWGFLETGELADRSRLRDVLSRHNPVGVLHFAAFASVRESIEDPALYYSNNVLGTLSLLEAMREAGIGVIVFSSSCAIYGIPLTLPIDESHRQEPVSPYGAGKSMVERILRDYSSAFGIHSVSLRYFNAAGADPAADIGENHEPETHAIPLAIESALGRRSTFEIYGTDYPTPDGSAVRDYVHVSDLADAHVAALAYLLGGGVTVALNLGTGIGTSVLQLIKAVEDISGRNLPVSHRARRPGDPPILIANAKQAQSILGWQARYLHIEETIYTAWKWHCVKANKY